MSGQILPEYIDDILLKYSDKKIVTDGNHRVSAKDLELRTNKLAHCLISQGIERGDRVAVCMRRSVNYIEAMIGVLKADAAYIPINPDTPAERLSKVLRDCKPKAIVGDAIFFRKGLFEEADEAPLQVSVSLNEIEAARATKPKLIAYQEVAQFSSSPISYRNVEEDVACILYTSGSTGSPKGVMITHRNIVEYVSWAIARTGISHNDRILCTAPFHFDMSLFDIYCSLRTGASLCIAKENLLIFPKLLIEFAEAEEITIWKGVSSLLMYLARTSSITEERLKSLRVILFSGEVLPTKYLIHWMRTFPSKVFYNAYGPTETTGISMYYRVDVPPVSADERIPIGKACENKSVYLLDENRRPVAPGEPGELYIGGAGVTKGYLNDEKRTAEAFLNIPLESGGNEKVYKTGDFARLRPDGNYEFLGRKDNQVKYMGYRIELADIEQSLVSIDGVLDAAVILVESESTGVAELIAYVEKKKAAALSDICMKARAKLPPYMVPKHIYEIIRLPRSDRGKIDRSSLISYHKEKAGRNDH